MNEYEMEQSELFDEILNKIKKQKDIKVNSLTERNSKKQIFITTGTGKTTAWLDIIKRGLEEGSLTSYQIAPYVEIEYGIVDSEYFQERFKENMKENSFDEIDIFEKDSSKLSTEDDKKKVSMRVSTRNFLNKGRKW